MAKPEEESEDKHEGSKSKSKGWVRRKTGESIRARQMMLGARCVR
jgi:hypothetical protein